MNYIPDNLIIFNLLTYVMQSKCVSIITSWLSHSTLPSYVWYHGYIISKLTFLSV